VYTEAAQDVDNLKRKVNTAQKKINGSAKESKKGSAKESKKDNSK
jgi:hypothetical protein